MTTQRTVDELTAMFVDNDSGLITPEMLRDLVVSTVGVTGWADYTDSTYTDASPQALPGNTATKVQIDGVVKREQELPYGVSTLWDNTNNVIPMSQPGTGIVVTFETTIRRISGTGRWEFDVFLDIGLPGPVELYARSIALDNGTNDKAITFSTGAYCLDTWVANGAGIFIRPETAAECHSSRVVIHQTHRGRGTYPLLG